MEQSKPSVKQSLCDGQPSAVNSSGSLCVFLQDATAGHTLGLNQSLNWQPLTGLHVQQGGKKIRSLTRLDAFISDSHKTLES